MTNKEKILNLLIEKRELEKSKLKAEKRSEREIHNSLYSINRDIYILENNLWIPSFNHYNFDEDKEDYTSKRIAYDYMVEVIAMFYYLNESLKNLKNEGVTIPKELFNKCTFKGFNKELENYHYLLSKFFIDIRDEQLHIIMEKKGKEYIINSKEKKIDDYKKMLEVFKRLDGSGNFNFSLNEIKEITDVLN